ncbi:transposase [Streptomyces sp. NPDC020794]|uniref:transposase n=1 Tax=unclassified Streptomyces TaxID=2593676 RepID=UPI0036E7F51E
MRARIEPLMSAEPEGGRWWADHRRTLEAIAWKYHTGSLWRDLPDELGSFQTARNCRRRRRTPPCLRRHSRSGR